MIEGRGFWIMDSTCLSAAEQTRLALTAAGEHIFRDNTAPNTLAAAVAAKQPRMLKPPQLASRACLLFFCHWQTSFVVRGVSEQAGVLPTPLARRG
jgi:hypothetical protein